MTTILYEHYGEPEIGFAVLEVIHTYLNLRVIFTKGCVNNAALLDPDNYSIIVADPTVDFDFGALSVTPESGAYYPTYVDLEVTDCTGGGEYELVVTPNVIMSQDSELLGSGVNSKEFIGVTEAPIVLAILSLSLTQVKVVFSKYMAQLEELYDPNNYVWTGGVRTLKVEADTNSSVILTVTTMIASQIYDLTVG